MLAHLQNVALQLGLPFAPRKYTYNSRLAQELGLWAETKNKGHEFHMAAFHAYFGESKNLAKPEVLLEIVDKLGFDRDEAKDILANRTFSSAVDDDWQLSRRMRVTAVPTFMMENTPLVGAQPYADLERFIRGFGVKPRPHDEAD